MNEGAATLELREVRGPSAFASSWRRFWSLLLVAARTDFKARYASAILGQLWALLRPLAIALTLYLIFTSVLRFGGDIEHFAVLLVMNVMLFSFFSEATSAALRSMVVNERIVRKTQFPRAVIPMAVVANHTITLGLSMFVVAGFLAIEGVEFRWTWFLLPVTIALLILLTMCVAMLLSALYPRYRDVSNAWVVIRRVLFYGSAVLFPIELIPGVFQKVVLVSPVAPLMVQNRQWMFDPDAPGLMEVAGVWGVIGPVAVFAAVCVAGVVVFVRRAPRIAEEL